MTGRVAAPLLLSDSNYRTRNPRTSLPTPEAQGAACAGGNPRPPEGGPRLKVVVGYTSTETHASSLSGFGSILDEETVICPRPKEPGVIWRRAARTAAGYSCVGDTRSMSVIW